MTQVVELSLNAEIVSVSGVVNGESYAFALTGSTADGKGIWTAAVTRAADDVYRISITAVNQRGTASQISTILYYGLNLITDRTQLDVDRAKALRKKGWAKMTAAERAEWENGLKGAYNVSDLNRVQSAMRYIRDRLTSLGYNVELSQHKTWTNQDVPMLADMNNYLSDVRAIREAFAVFETTPPVPDDMSFFTYVQANQIEQILLDVDTLLSSVLANLVYSGEIYGGEM